MKIKNLILASIIALASSAQADSNSCSEAKQQIPVMRGLSQKNSSVSTFHDRDVLSTQLMSLALKISEACPEKGGDPVSPCQIEADKLIQNQIYLESIRSEMTPDDIQDEIKNQELYIENLSLFCQ